jgi:WXG100 family type VII secretion target
LVVDLAGLAELGERMRRFETHVAALRTEVDRRMRELDAAWSGAAARSRETADAQWRAGAAEVHEALTAMRGVVTTAHENYLAAASANRRMWAR